MDKKAIRDSIKHLPQYFTGENIIRLLEVRIPADKRKIRNIIQEMRYNGEIVSVHHGLYEHTGKYSFRGVQYANEVDVAKAEDEFSRESKGGYSITLSKKDIKNESVSSSLKNDSDKVDPNKDAPAGKLISANFVTKTITIAIGGGPVPGPGRYRLIKISD